MRFAASLLALFCVFVLLPGCGGGEDESVIKIGVAGPMTGDQARNGEELRLGTILAAEEWNAKGGLLGKRIVVVEKDDQALEPEAGKVANELMDAGVKAVIGHYNSGVTFPASKEYAKRGIVMITPASTNPVITEHAGDKGIETIFRVCGRDDIQGTTAAEFLKNELKIERVMIFHDKTTYGEGLASDFRKAVEKVGITVTDYQGFDNKERNFRPYLPKLREGDPQVWYFGGIHNQGGPLARQAKESGYEIPFMSGDGVFHPEFLAKAGDKAEGALFTFPDVYSSDEAKAFVKRYEKRFEKGTGPYSVYAYTAANILFESIEKAGTTDGKKVAAAIRGMEHQTVFDPISFDRKGDVTRSIYTIWTVQDGKFVLWRNRRK